MMSNKDIFFNKKSGFSLSSIKGTNRDRRLCTTIPSNTTIFQLNEVERSYSIKQTNGIVVSDRI